MTRWGTSYFVSLRTALAYYRPYCSGTKAELAEMVGQKLKEGSIHIGKPSTKAGETLSVVAGEGRYQIEERT